MNDDELLAELQGALERPVPPIDEARVSAVRAAAAATQAGAADEPAVDGPPPPPTVIGDAAGRRGMTGRRAWLIGAAAAAVGAIGGVVGANIADDDPQPAAGPPTEPITWQPAAGAVAGSAVQGKLINHTWGVELLLDATGFPVGTAYTVAYLDAAGTTTDAGGFIGAELPIHCRCNGPRLRADVRAIEIRDPSGTVVERATLA